MKESSEFTDTNVLKSQVIEVWIDLDQNVVLFKIVNTDYQSL